MALLMEGQFPSAFKDYLPQAIKSDTSFAYQEKSVPTKMIVIGDGDIVRNAVKPSDNGPMPIALGYDRYAQRIIYDNKEFLLNCMNYLMDDEALISVRSRTIKLRKLDQDIIASNKTRIQIENSVLPLGVVLLLGIGQYFYRKRKYTKVA
jgi:ABC-2 type transport system permease protein